MASPKASRTAQEGAGLPSAAFVLSSLVLRSVSSEVKSKLSEDTAPGAAGHRGATASQLPILSSQVFTRPPPRSAEVLGLGAPPRRLDSSTCVSTRVSRRRAARKQRRGGCHIGGAPPGGGRRRGYLSTSALPGAGRILTGEPRRQESEGSRRRRSCAPLEKPPHCDTGPS